MALSTNPLLNKAINRVLNSNNPTRISISLRIYTDANADFSWTPLFLESLFIVQDFSNNYADDITVESFISPNDYIKLHENMGDLRAAVTITYLATSTNEIVISEKPIIKKYYAMLINPKDLKRTTQAAHKRTAETMVVKIRLIDIAVYNTRQKRFHGILKNITMGAAIRHIAVAFGIDKMQMVTPDNKHEYEHIIIPPSKGLEDIFEYLQDRYGIYYKGICSYITNETLFISPIHEINSSTDILPINLYMGDSGEHAGPGPRHNKTEDIIEIVLEGNSEIIDMAQAVGENDGTGYMLTRSNRLIDGYIKTSNDSGSVYTNDTSMQIELNESGSTISPNQHHIKQLSDTTDNIFKVASDLYMYKLNILQINWLSPRLDFIKPVHPITYIYDDNSVIANVKGVVEAIGYDFVREGPIGNSKHAYSGVSKMRIRLAPYLTK